MEIFLTYLSFLFFIIGQGITDGFRDSCVFDSLYGDKVTFFVKLSNWHYIKTISRVSTAVAFFIKGYLSVSYYNFEVVLLRLPFECLIVWLVWHLTYYYGRYGNPFEVNKADHIIYIPKFMKDTFIGLHGISVIAFHIFRFVVGVGGLIFIEVYY